MDEDSHGEGDNGATFTTTTTMKGNSLPTITPQQTTEKPIRRTFSAVFRKRVLLFFRPWKWSRRKTDSKRTKSCSHPPGGPTRSVSGIEGHPSEDNLVLSSKNSYSTNDLSHVSPSQLDVKFELSLDGPTFTSTNTTTTTNTNNASIPNGEHNKTEKIEPNTTTTTTTTTSGNVSSQDVLPNRTEEGASKENEKDNTQLNSFVNNSVHNTGVGRGSPRRDLQDEKGVRTNRKEDEEEEEEEELMVTFNGPERGIDVPDVVPSSCVEVVGPSEDSVDDLNTAMVEEEETMEMDTTAVVSVVESRRSKDVEEPPPIPPRERTTIVQLPSASSNPCISMEDEQVVDGEKSGDNCQVSDTDSMSDPDFEYYESTASDEEEESRNNVVTGLASKVRRSDSLALRLASRPSRGELENKNIIVSKNEDEKVEERTTKASSLVRRLSQRPSKEELEQRNILRSQTEQEAHEQFVETRKQLSRKLSRRPTVKELRKKKIIGFNEYVEVFDVQEYDRRADKPWTRLTPKDKASIRKELNEYKEYEMEVHEESKQFTRFHRP